MIKHSHGVRCCAVLSLLSAVLAAGAFPPTVRGQEVAPVDESRPFRGCGKARAAAGMLHAEPASVITAARLEAMAETDMLHYALDIEISNINTVSETCTITGSNAMTIQSKSASLSEFTLRLASQYNITAAYTNGSTPVGVTTTSETTRVVTLDRTYGLDEVFTLTIEYAGDTANAQGSFGAIEVVSRYGNPEVSTLSEPYYAYTWWPSKDGDLYQPGDNSDKATLEFSITVPDDMTVPSNGALQSVETLTGNRERYNWASNYPIPTYLVSFAATIYNTWTVDYTYPGGTMPVEFYVYPALDTASNRNGWELSVDMLATFRTLFGEYPFIDEKYGIYNFAFGGGMEHQTITGQGGFSEGLTSHELAHQWWGDMVTCKTWNHIWLNEGFASYGEALWKENEPGSTGLVALKSYMAGMRYTGAGSVYVYDDEVDELWEIFNGSTSYDKGAWVVHMLRRVLGDDNFFDALAAYRAAFQHGAATTEDLQAICETFYDDNSLAWFFQEWVYGEYAPSYNWGWDSVLIDGSHYVLLSVDQTQPVSQQRFTMPIDFVADGTTHVVFNDADTEHFVIPVTAAPLAVALDPDDWILRSGRFETSYAPGPPKIVKTEPAPGGMVAYPNNLTRINVWYHTDVDAADADFLLVGAMTGPQAVTVAPESGTNPIKLDLAVALAPDTYTLTVFDGVTALDSLMILDGEVADPIDSASLPSGDGSPGGDAVIQFSVAGIGSIPAVSNWGLVVVTLLILTAGTIVVTRRRCSAA